jgi:hypothetical protein
MDKFKVSLYYNCAELVMSSSITVAVLSITSAVFFRLELEYNCLICLLAVWRQDIIVNINNAATQFYDTSTLGYDVVQDICDKDIYPCLVIHKQVLM